MTARSWAVMTIALWLLGCTAGLWVGHDWGKRDADRWWQQYIVQHGPVYQNHVNLDIPLPGGQTPWRTPK